MLEAHLPALETLDARACDALHAVALDAPKLEKLVVAEECVLTSLRLRHHRASGARASAPLSAAAAAYECAADETDDECMLTPAKQRPPRAAVGAAVGAEAAAGGEGGGGGPAAADAAAQEDNGSGEVEKDVSLRELQLSHARFAPEVRRPNRRSSRPHSNPCLTPRLAEQKVVGWLFVPGRFAAEVRTIEQWS